MYTWHTKDVVKIRDKKYDYQKLLGEYLRAQLFYSALELDLFSYLDEEISEINLSKKTGYNARNLKWILMALSSEGFIEKIGDNYINNESGRRFLSLKSGDYIGESLIRRKEMMDLSGLTEAVKYGKIDRKEEIYDFSRIAASSDNEFKLFREQNFINTIEKIYDKESSIEFLDLGGGLGSLSASILRNFPNAKGVVFEEKSVAELAKDFIESENLSSEIKVISGDFLSDEIGGDYDLIIASGIFHFAKAVLSDFLLKIKSSLRDEGYLLSATKTVSSDYQNPKGLVTRWLSGYINGLDALLTTEELDDALKLSGFVKCDAYSVKGIEIYRKG
ncbi:MAG: methyltransferase [Tissierellia bacterium]|nr:methyltransferase [Tissierellia bacterium]